jgi:pyruvate dehydrogenase E1 component alpha subunit/2-oxoisovalerate dehydrogenase E1 component alpha subunit
MILSRALDDRLTALYKRGGFIAGSVFTGRGQEAYAAAGGMMLRPGDIYAPLIRDQAGRLAFGEQIIDVVRTHLGKKTGPMRGRDGNIHRGQIEKGVLPMISHLGAMVAVVVGGLLARRLRGELSGNDHAVGMTAIGDGGMATGALHEGLNAAAIEKLPLVLLVANNQLSYSTFNDRSFACRDLVDRAVGYGVRGHSCDGTDSDDCLATVADAVARARRGEGPQMVVATLLRLSGHGQHDDATYVPAELKSRFGDCLQLSEKTLKLQGVADEAAIAALWQDARTQIDAAIEQAKGEPDPDPATEDWCAWSARDLKKVKS